MQASYRSTLLLGLAIVLAAGLFVIAAAPDTLIAPPNAQPTAPEPAAIFDAALATQPAEPDTRPSATQPATTNAATTTSPITTVPTTGPGKTLLNLNFKDASIDAVLDHLSEVAGFVVVKETAVSGRVTVISRRPVTPDEAVALLDTVLKGNGLTAIRMGKILKVTARDKAKKGNIPVHVGADPTVIDPSDELITQVIPLRSVDAVKLKADLAPLVSNDADLSANAASNSLILTDSAANIRRVVEIVRGLDQRQETENSIKVKQLKYADAVAAAKLITDIFKSDDQSNNPNLPPQVQFFRQFRQPGVPGGGAEEDKGRTGRVVASADQRTNTVVVTGPSDTLKAIDNLLTQIDSDPSAEQSFFIYSVKNGQAQDIAITLNSLFGNSTNGQTPSRSTSGTTNTFGKFNSSGFGGSGTSGFGQGGRGGGGGGGAFGGGGSAFGGGGGGGAFGGGGGGNYNGAGGNNRNNPQQQGGNVSPAIANAASALAGQVFIVADIDTNSLLVAAASKYRDRVKEIIETLDRPVPQVLIKVLIAEVTHDNSSDLGTDFSILNTRASGNGQTIISSLGNKASQVANGGLAVGILETNLTATLHVLAQQNKLDVLSRPYILASDNQIATITVGQEVPIITGSQTTDLGLINNSITYTQVGIILNVTPHINPEGLVILDVSPEVSQLTAQTVHVSNGVDAPVFDNRAADTRVGIRDGSTIVIGGMMQDQKTVAIDKIPLLGDIPWLGTLFQRKKLKKTKTELLIFLTPHVAQSPERLRPMSEDEMQGLRLTPDAVQRGTFQEHMRGMQRGGGPTTQPVSVPPPTTQPRSLAEPQLPGTH